MIRFPFLPGSNRKNDIDSTLTLQAQDQHKREREQFKTVLESYKATRITDRLQVLDIFLSTEQHITLSELEALIREKNPELRDREFLQETMEMFCRFGFAQKRTFDNQESLFEHHYLGTHHDHFICTRCGLIQEFVNPELEQLQLAIAGEFQFHPLQHKMEIYGLCANCMEQRDVMLPLLLAAKGEQVIITRVGGGRENQARLAQMGLTVGARLDIISNHASGPFIVAVHGTRLAINADIARHIRVSHSCRLSGAGRTHPDSP